MKAAANRKERERESDIIECRESENHHRQETSVSGSNNARNGLISLQRPTDSSRSSRHFLVISMSKDRRRLTANGEVRLTVNHLHDDDVVDDHVDCQFRRRIVQRVLFLFSKLVCDAADYDGDGSVVVAARRFSRRRLRNSTRNLNVKSD